LNNLKRVCLELSLKPFKSTEPDYIESVCRKIFTHWSELTAKAEKIAVMMWTADGSELLDYKGDLEEIFEWDRFIGGANPRQTWDKVNDPECREQLEQFHHVLDTIHAAGFETGVVHAAGSFALLHDQSARLDGVRAGSAILGRCRRTRDDKLKTVGYGEAPLVEVRWLPKGHTIGADKPIVLKKPTRVAVIPVGYQNGLGVSWQRDTGLLAFLRRWKKNRKRTVRIGEHQRARVLGPIGATETILDVTRVKCSVGDLATFDIDPMFARGFKREYR